MSRSRGINNSPEHLCVNVCVRLSVCVYVSLERERVRQRRSLTVGIKHPQLPLASLLWTANCPRCSRRLEVYMSSHCSFYQLIYHDLKQWSGINQGQTQGPIYQTGSAAWLIFLNQTNNTTNHQMVYIAAFLSYCCPRSRYFPQALLFVRLKSQTECDCFYPAKSESPWYSRKEKKVMWNILGDRLSEAEPMSW